MSIILVLQAVVELYPDLLLLVLTFYPVRSGRWLLQQMSKVDLRRVHERFDYQDLEDWPRSQSMGGM